jgi:hypothetical protein
MSLLGLELSDAGIMVAGSEPLRLLEVDEGDQASPGYALFESDGLRVGKTAEQKAHFFPHLINSHFWDQLNRDPLDYPGPQTRRSHAEIAYAHLTRIWDTVKEQGNQMIVAVPGFYRREQLGLFLGMANELSLPIKGFVPLALAAAGVPIPGKTLLHLDMHLHRTEVLFLNQGAQLTIANSVSIAKGLTDLYREWIETIAAEFVRTTRFDPLDQARWEQELYDRLPGILKQLQHAVSVDFEMTVGAGSFRVTLPRMLFIEKSIPFFTNLRRTIEKTLDKDGKDASEATLQLTHRIAPLPGCKDALAELNGAHLIELEAGAASKGALKLRNLFPDQDRDRSPVFLTGRSWQTTDKIHVPASSAMLPESRPPTHLLYRNLAYPLSETPLLIRLVPDSDEGGLQIKGPATEISQKHCSVEIRGKEIVLKDFSTSGTFVDGTRVNGSTTLKIGQIVRIGTPGEKMQLIACLDRDEN